MEFKKIHPHQSQMFFWNCFADPVQTLVLRMEKWEPKSKH